MSKTRPGPKRLRLKPATSVAPARIAKSGTRPASNTMTPGRASKSGTRPAGTARPGRPSKPGTQPASASTTPGRAPKPAKRPGRPARQITTARQDAKPAPSSRSRDGSDRPPLDPSRAPAATDPPRSGRAFTAPVDDLASAAPLRASLLPVLVSLHQTCEEAWQRLDRIYSEELWKYSLSASGRGTVVQVLEAMIRLRARLLGALGRLIEPEIDQPEPSLRLQSMSAPLRARLLAAAYSIAEERQPAAEASRLVGIRDQALARALSRLPGALAESEAAVARIREGIFPLDDSLVAEALSLPLWLTRLFAAQRGWLETAALGLALLEPPPLTLRVAPDRLSRGRALERLRSEAGLVARPTPLSPFGFRLPVRMPLDRLEMYQRGELEVQDEGSQLIALAVGGAPGERVLDLCAGAGGKILLIASIQALNGAPGETIACDPHRGRIQEMKRRLARAGIKHVQVRTADALDPHALVDLNGRMDRILVDAPCSGLGALRRNPEAKWRLKEEDLKRFPDLQRRLIERASLLLRKGGRLLYATCTLNRDENEGLIDAAVAATGLQLAPLRDTLGSIGDRLGLDAEQSRLELLPHRHDTDGFFLASLSR